MTMTFPARRGRRAARASILSSAAIAVLCVPGIVAGPALVPAKHDPTVATGSIICTQVAGIIGFSSPVHAKVVQMDTLTISVDVAGCKTEHSNVAHVAGGKLTLKVTTMVHGCPADGVGADLTGTETWLPSSIAPSRVISEDYSSRVYAGGKTLVYSSKNTSGLLVIVFPAAGNSFSVTGSFAGKASYQPVENLHGSLEVYTNWLTGPMHSQACKTAGISAVNIERGVETLP
ncbi:MAG TPA: hypothetical protein VED84_08840 [Acidimicrobiales bacterium]|nr:hypothetical protein [Acidimicrobiales bacterium]